MKKVVKRLLLIPALLWLAFILWVAWNHPFYFIAACTVIGVIQQKIEKRKQNKAGN